jgi:hypothetical protein
MITIYTRSKFHRQHSRENLISYVSLYSNVVTASVSNVNIVCYGYLTPTTYCMRHWHFAPISYTSLICYSNIVYVTDILLQCLHYKLSTSGTRSGVQTYKTCQLQQKLSTCTFVYIQFISYCSCYFNYFYIVEKRNDLYIVGYQINIEKHYFSQRSRHRNL